MQLRDAELGVQSARSELDDMRAQRLAAEGRLRQLEQERSLREKELAAERGALAGELRVAYVNGREEQLKLLLNQEDPAGFGRMLTYYGYFGRARAGRIEDIRDKLEHLALVREKIAGGDGSAAGARGTARPAGRCAEVVAGGPCQGGQCDQPADQDNRAANLRG